MEGMQGRAPRKRQAGWIFLLQKVRKDEDMENIFISPRQA